MQLQNLLPSGQAQDGKKGRRLRTTDALHLPLEGYLTSQKPPAAVFFQLPPELMGGPRPHKAKERGPLEHCLRMKPNRHSLSSSKTASPTGEKTSFSQRGP